MNFGDIFLNLIFRTKIKDNDKKWSPVKDWVSLSGGVLHHGTHGSLEPSIWILGIQGGE